MRHVTTPATDWLEALCARLGVTTPTDEERAAILELAAHAAHASERSAAPVACWIAASAGLSIEDALAVAREITPPAS